jgi:hypothetical protein
MAILTRVTSADAQENLANVDTGDSAVGLAPRTTHTRLQSIGTGTRQHLVDTDDVVGVGADAEMEAFLAGSLDEVLVGANTRGLEGLGAQLLILVGDQVDAQGEVVDGGTLAAEIEDANLGVRHTTVEARLRVRLQKQVVSKLMSSSNPQSKSPVAKSSSSSRRPIRAFPAHPLALFLPNSSPPKNVCEYPSSAPEAKMSLPCSCSTGSI